MKLQKQILQELQERKDFQVLRETFDGGAGIFVRGPKKGMTVIWSFGGGWEHVSMDGRTRTPTWEEMCELKEMFWNPDETCCQYHPAEKSKVNNLQHCLHIWKPIEQYSGTLPVHPELFVGIPGVRFKEET